MLYPKNQENALSDELFLNPTSEYRGAPVLGMEYPSGIR